MDWTGHWIWAGGDDNPWDAWRSFRKTFRLERKPEQATLRITADTRYVVWINGTFIGQGPPRAWPHRWQYDCYDIADHLTPGDSVIAVLVLHYGIATFQSLSNRAGLLAEIACGTEVVASTDTTWVSAAMPGRTRAGMPRITCQQAWSEYFDSREPGASGWTSSDFDDSCWDRCIDIGPAGCQPWETLVPRDIPFLTQEPLTPERLLEARVVQRPSQTWGLELRRNLQPGVLDANQHRICGLVVAVVEADADGTVTLASPQEGNYAPGQLRVNGQDVERLRGIGLKFDPGYTFTFSVRRGANLLVWDVTGNYHAWTAAWVVKSSDARLEPQQWTSAGPFEALEDEDFQKVWNCANSDDLQPLLPLLKTFDPFDLHHEQPFLDTVQAEKVADLSSNLQPPCEIAANSGDVEVLYDFGKMTVGFWEFDLADAPEGVVIDLVGFESIQDGSRDYTWGLNNAARYITRSGTQSFHSHIRRGCRYLAVTFRFPAGSVRPVQLTSIRTVQNTYPCTERGSFECSDELLNDIWKMGAYTTRLCSEDTYVDCPTYEQTFWVGDSRNEGACNHYAFGEYALSRRCLLLAAESLSRSPLVESQVPSGWQDILPTWSLLWVLACEEYWQVTGDGDFLARVYPAVASQTRALLGMVREDGLLWVAGWNLLDWAPLDTPGDAACTHTSAWFALVLERQAVMAEALGRASDVPELNAARESLLRAMNEHLWDEERHAYVDSKHADGSLSGCISQQTNTVVLLAGAAPPDRADKIKPLVVEAPEGVVPVGSPFFMFFTFEALAQLGRFDQILDLTRKWWGFMLETGATTCWETFPGFEPGGRYTRSHCHAWSAAPTYFLSRYQLGVSPLKAGFSRALIAPEPASLDSAAGSVPTPHGPIAVDWRITVGSFTLNAALPAGVSALVRLPGAAEDYVAVDAPGLTPGGSPLEFEVPAGASVAITASLRQTPR